QYHQVFNKFHQIIHSLAPLYINSLNLIHYIHHKYTYQPIQIPLHHTQILPTIPTPIPPLSLPPHSLSPIKYPQLKPIPNQQPLLLHFQIQPHFPKY
ncbi:pyruvate formate lyase family protein, partial [Staphylococcus aureus]|uniref:pyruvate formate lyase family protein n=1 Tax=Staphylococcus aureus TaxID=1280 RepID=UPI0037D9EB45